MKHSVYKKMIDLEVLPSTLILHFQAIIRIKKDFEGIKENEKLKFPEDQSYKKPVYKDNRRQNLWNNLEKGNKIDQAGKTLISVFV